MQDARWKRDSPRAIALVALGLAAITVLLYARVAGFEFILFDDGSYVTENPHVRGGLSWSDVEWAFTAFHSANWHPLTWLSHMLDVQLFGLAPGPHHLVNVALHAANAALLFVVLARMTGATGRSAAVALLFAVHPLRVESVAWVAERKDVLSTLFGLLALGAYRRYCERPGVHRYVLVAVAFAASLLSKPMWVTLPFLLLVLDWWPLGRVPGAPPRPAGPLSAVSWSRALLEKLPLAGMSAASAAITIAAQRSANAVTPMESLGTGARLANAFVSYLRYAGKTVWPEGLSVYYPHPRVIPLAVAAAAGATVLAASAAAVVYARRLPWLLAGWFWFVGTLVPVIGVVQVGGQAMADRYTYLPGIGLLVVASWGAHRLAGHWRAGGPLGAACASVAAALMLLTWHQLSFWRDHVTLFRRAVAVAPDGALAHDALARGLMRRKELPEALVEAREAVRLAPRHGGGWMTVALVERELGNLDRAREAALEAARWGYVGAWSDLGVLLAIAGRTEEADAALHAAARLDPRNPASWYNLGVFLSDNGRRIEAVDALTRAVQLDPLEPDALFRLGLLDIALGRRDHALRVATQLANVDARRAADLRTAAAR
jgi:tetratricopeptide (TPR) repeat protein